MKKVTRLLLVASVAAMGVGGFAACSDDVTVVEPPPPPPPPVEDAELTIKSVENFQGENVDPDSVAGQIVVVFNVEAGDFDIQEIQLVVDGDVQTCQTVSGGGAISGAQASVSGQAQQEVECVLNTAAIAGECTGEQLEARFTNAEHTIGGNLVLVDGGTVSASNEVTLNFQNPSFLVIAGPDDAEGVVGNGVRFWGGADLEFAACPVDFEGRTVGEVRLAGTTEGGTATVIPTGNTDVDLGAGHGALATDAEAPFVFTATVAANADEVEDDPDLGGHTVGSIGSFEILTDEGENIGGDFDVQEFEGHLDFTGPLVGPAAEITIDGQPADLGMAMTFHFSAGDFGTADVFDLGVGVDAADLVIAVIDGGGAGAVVVEDAEAIADVPEDDDLEYLARAEEVVDRLGNVTADTIETNTTFGVDKTAPDITDEAPAEAGLVVNDTAVSFTAVDPDLESGDPGSGVDAASITAEDGGGALPVADLTGGDFEVDITTLADGAHVVTVDVPDLAELSPNVAMTEFDFILDTTAPEFGALDPVPGGSAGTDATSIIQRIGGTITDANVIASAVISVFADGTDAEGTGGDDTCTTGDHLLSVDAGEIDRNEVDVATDTEDIEFEEAFEIFEPTSASVTVTYCFIIEASDEAVDRFGDPNPNTSDLSTPADVTWNG